jgi:hypothetical protein
VRLPALVVAWSALLGIKRALTGRAPAPGELRYHVPPGQDPAAALAAVRATGLSATIALDGGYEDVVVTCDPDRDREAVRAALRDAPRDMAGKEREGAPIVFADEVVPRAE